MRRPNEPAIATTVNLVEEVVSEIEEAAVIEEAAAEVEITESQAIF